MADDTPETFTPEPDHRLSADPETGLAYPLGEPPAPGRMIEAAEGVHWVRMPLPWSLDHINLYVLADGETWTVVDTGIRSKELKARWEEIFAGDMKGRPVTRIVATHHHPDHLGLAAWMAERFSAPIHATRTAWLMARTLMLDVRDAPPEEVIAFSRRAGLGEEALERLRQSGWGNFAKGVEALPVGYVRLAEGDVLEIGGTAWHVIETAGHAPGHASLYAPARRLLLSGDQVLPKISSNVSVYPTEPFGNPLAEWLEGLARLKALPDDVLVLPSHNAPFTGLHARLDALIGKHAERLNGVAALCAEAPRSAVEVFPALFRRRISGMEFMMATGEALAHLHFLEARGVLARSEEDGVARFAAVAPYDEAALRRELAAVTERTKGEAPWAA